HCLVSFFFFQAEDGIRDFHVTGVQTCALPILAIQLASSVPVAPFSKRMKARATSSTSTDFICEGSKLSGRSLMIVTASPITASKIGRASCREGGAIWGEADEDKNRQAYEDEQQ